MTSSLSKRKHTLERDIERLAMLVDDLEFMRALSTEDVHSVYNRLLEYQRRYKVITGGYYYPDRKI